jgi:hypothetical protein
MSAIEASLSFTSYFGLLITIACLYFTFSFLVGEGREGLQESLLNAMENLNKMYFLRSNIYLFLTISNG